MVRRRLTPLPPLSTLVQGGFSRDHVVDKSNADGSFDNARLPRLFFDDYYERNWELAEGAKLTQLRRSKDD